MRPRQRGEHRLVDQEEGNRDLEDPRRLQLASSGELLVEREDRLQRHACQGRQRDGERGDHVRDRQAVDVRAAQGVARQCCEREEVLCRMIRFSVGDL